MEPRPLADDFRLDAYAFDLPEALIAQRPADRRDHARMLVLDRQTGSVEDRHFYDIGRYLRAGDALVVNNTRVVPARLVGTREPGGGAAELLLVERRPDGTWIVLARPGRKLREGARVRLAGDLVAGVVRVRPDGRREVRFAGPGGAPFPSPEAEEAALDAAGQLPLPPYIARDAPDASDRERYQTVFARARGAVAAPTAGLHFTPAVLEALREQGVHLAEVTLHVGYGTFEPVKTDDLRAHAVAPERAEVLPATAAALNAARAAGGRIVAVGTTSVRTLESAAGPDGRLRPLAAPTGLTVTPGYRFRAVDALLTNFHLPRSSLLVLVSAFAGRERVLAAYRHAVAQGYRFYSYGDCMLII
ncbi:MAG: tRNA preQ1(34) S-adenosylmethionine ribosyltransferase-isomerase QueA [Rubricoccaceae bacterium]